jgi:tetratricopeptide (TPR) repeat protein
MKYSWYLGGTAALIASTATPLAAKTSTEVQNIAKATTIEIKLSKNSKVGSGVLIHRQGNTYTLVTNRHVVCGGDRCDTLPPRETYTLKLVDGQQQRINASAVKIFENNLDLAIIQFQSDKQYKIAPIAKDLLKVDEMVYTAGFPAEKPGFTFNKGRAIAVVNKRLTADKGGYSIIYNAVTLPGMSGGGVFNTNGELVAIHGIGDRIRPGTELNDSKLDTKIGYNRGIPIRWLVQNINRFGINLGTATAPEVPGNPTTADEYFIIGFNKFVDPGEDFLAGKQQAIASFNNAIKLNPQYATAYFNRAYTYEQLGEFDLAVKDYTQAIALDPKFPEAYTNRGRIKVVEFKDAPGALADYNQSIAIDPQYSDTYNNRGLLQADNFNKPQAALADYNQAIKLNPRASVTYYNRAILKEEKLNDKKGALADYTQAISLDPKYAKAYNNRSALRLSLKDIPGAVADIENAISLNPKFTEAYNNRGLLKANNLNDPQGALADFNRAIALDPKLAAPYYNRGNLRANKLKDDSGAFADMNKAIGLNPTYAEAYLGRGVIKGRQNDQTGALADWRKAEQLFRSQGQTEIADKIAATLKKFGAN